ncbi:DoxX family protein [Phaeodactylibacter xiamenensis]|uniref:DoxX family protein n=1 Tax=Phaeodactylibacter xiamenensis TaxID=1524460 RepID=UPI0024A88FE6|nr:DoxX family protein [Phaeodactylibacter xiamenensis]
MQKLIGTTNDRSLLLIRLMVGFVFLSEGIQKFLFPAVRGAGRFEKLGFSDPDFLSAFVGSVEVAGGVLILAGLLTRIGAVPLFLIMIVAISTTKVDILADKGMWEMLHAARTDWSMLLGSLFLLIKGGGRWSADWYWQHHANLSTSQNRNQQ